MGCSHLKEMLTLQPRQETELNSEPLHGFMFTLIHCCPGKEGQESRKTLDTDQAKRTVLLMCPGMQKIPTAEHGLSYALS